MTERKLKDLLSEGGAIKGVKARPYANPVYVHVYDGEWHEQRTTIPITEYEILGIVCRAPVRDAQAISYLVIKAGEHTYFSRLATRSLDTIVDLPVVPKG